MEWNRTDLKEDVSVCATADLVQHLSLATEDVLNKFFFFFFSFCFSVRREERSGLGADPIGPASD